MLKKNPTHWHWYRRVSPQALQHLPCIIWESLIHHWHGGKGGCDCTRLPVGDVGSVAIDPSLLMVLMTKFFSRVKFVSPTLSELSITNTMSRAPQCFSQSETEDKRPSACWKATFTSPCLTGYFLTTATTRLFDVSHDITVLQWRLCRLEEIF